MCSLLLRIVCLLVLVFYLLLLSLIRIDFQILVVGLIFNDRLVCHNNFTRRRELDQTLTTSLHYESSVCLLLLLLQDIFADHYLVSLARLLLIIFFMIRIMHVHNKVIFHVRVKLSINFLLASLNILHSHSETFIFLNFFLATGCEIKNSEKVVGKRLCLDEVLNIDSHLLDLVSDLQFSFLVQLQVPLEIGINFFLALLVI